MINAEKYRDKLLKFIEERDAGSFSFSEGEEGDFWQCGGRRCSECGMSKERSNCSLERLKWLLSEYKEPVKLSRLEYGILKFLLNDTGYRYIARNKYRHEGGVYNLYIFKDEPFEDSGVWCSGRDSGNEFYVFNNLFAFVKWEDSKPTSIKDVLDNCEVVEDAEE